MNRFKRMSEIVYYVIEEIIVNNQDLMKLIYYGSYDPISEPDIINPQSVLIPDYIYPGFKIPDTEEKQKCILTVECDDAMLTENPKFINKELIFNIICHTDLWMISKSIRPYDICGEIDEMFGEKRNSNLGMGNISLHRFNKIIYNNKFAGYIMSYKLCDTN